VKILTVVGARPQFIKAAPVSKGLQAAGHREFLLHTGQHYDHGMSQVFFDELGMRPPDVNLDVRSGSHGQQTGQMLMRIEDILLQEKPDWVLVFGDTNSTLAGALAAIKLHIPLAHVEAGLRSFNRLMPEEHNRVLTDHCADLLLCPTQVAVDNLAREGITQGVHKVGDPMYDAALMFGEVARARSTIIKDLGLGEKQFLLLTVHRQENADQPAHLRSILDTLGEVDERVVFPVHPRTRARIADAGIALAPNISTIEPVGYLDMLQLEQSARLILTDSGGVQKEAYFFATPCLTLRTETEWIETVEYGWNNVVNVDRERILAGIQADVTLDREHPPVYGDGYASERIAALLGQLPGILTELL